LEAVHDPLISRDSVLVSDGRPSYFTFANDRGLLHVAAVTKQAERVYEGLHFHNVNVYAEVPVELPQVAPLRRARWRSPHTASHARRGDELSSNIKSEQSLKNQYPLTIN
jgi:hypothetical protein